jgi:phosphoribosylanthranilate isomerase
VYRVAHTFIKICGLTNVGQAKAAAALGADAIGLVFAPSPRRLDYEQARRIVDALPRKLAKVGVFVNADAEQIIKTVQRTGITHAQLHGEESPDLPEELPVRCIKTVRVRGLDFAPELCDWVNRLRDPGSLAAVLLDAYSVAAHGGTGEAFNWDLLVEARNAGLLDCMPPMMLAGGLTPENVTTALEQARPWGVDVSSGVESAPGVKDVEKIERFIQTVRDAETDE